MRARAAKTAAAMGTSAAVAEPPKKRTSIPQFIKEVQAEAKKITWTSRKETWITSVMVGIMVVMAAIFFQVVDLSLGFIVTSILKLANAG